MTTVEPLPTRLLFFAGSQREKSWNKRVARLGADIAKTNGIDATFADLADYDMPIYSGDIETKSGAPDGAHRFKALLERHDGVFIISPEYNASFSPLLKNTLDWVSHIREPDKPPMQVFKSRVFAVGSASSGGMGGLRGLSQLRIVLELGLGALVLPDQFALPRVNEAFDDQGQLKNKDQQAQFATIIDRLARTAKAITASGTPKNQRHD